MFALVVVFGDIGGQAVCGGSKRYGAIGEAGDVFEKVGIFDGCGSGLAPGEGRVSGYEDAGDGDGVEALFAEEAGDDCAGVVNVGFVDLFGGEGLGDGNGAVEIVGVGGAEAGDGLAGLRPGSCKFGMGMDDATDLGKFAVEEQVGVEVAGGVECAFDDGAVEAREDEVACGERGVADTAGLDGHEGLFAGTVDSATFDTAGVAEGMDGESAARDFLVGVQDLFAKRG